MGGCPSNPTRLCHISTLSRPGYSTNMSQFSFGQASQQQTKPSTYVASYDMLNFSLISKTASRSARQRRLQQPHLHPASASGTQVQLHLQHPLPRLLASHSETLSHNSQPHKRPNQAGLVSALQRPSNNPRNRKHLLSALGALGNLQQQQLLLHLPRSVSAMPPRAQVQLQVNRPSSASVNLLLQRRMHLR